ncbi:RagB/SusD family nutrient uptake outer membrane protein [Nibrella saemangeumensis]|uniref:RagB/SusD family nutrient uptake outer membrane protein n=1 Tax=Nibrella saemangeumensis TaxID=1084526 RepID=A0ABP8N6L4_9BACT
MKSKYLCVLVAGLLTATTSCNEMLNPQPVGLQTIDATFTDFAGTLAAVNGAYSTLTSGNLYRGNNDMLYVDYASDDIVNVSKLASSAYSLVDYFELPADNGMTFGLWDGFYRLIYRSNVIINRVPGLTFPVAQSRNSAGTLFKDQFVGEAKFLRAFAYFNLVRLFGDVPLRTDEIKSPTDVNIPRTPAAQVYQQIIDDLKDAAAKLPPTYSGSGAGNERGRASRWAALAMLADVYLTQKNYAEAKTTAAQVITQSGLNLNPKYADNFAARGGQENTAESLFEIQFSNGGQASGTAPLGQNYSFIMGPTNNASGGVVNLAAYRPSDNTNSDNEAGFRGGLIQEYEEGDVRRDVNFGRGQSGDGTQRWLTVKYYVPGSGAVGQANFPVYRLAEVYLIYAEAANESNTVDALAYEYVNRLRRRAFDLPLTTASEKADLKPGLSQAEFRAAIRSERRKELAMENKRWFDLVRYGFDYTNQVLKVDQKRDNFTRDKLLFPIARIETLNNPLLTQNPGY